MSRQDCEHLGCRCAEGTGLWARKGRMSALRDAAVTARRLSAIEKGQAHCNQQRECSAAPQRGGGGGTGGSVRARIMHGGGETRPGHTRHPARALLQERCAGERRTREMRRRTTATPPHSANHHAAIQELARTSSPDSGAARRSRRRRDGPLLSKDQGPKRVGGRRLSVVTVQRGHGPAWSRSVFVTRTHCHFSTGLLQRLNQHRSTSTSGFRAPS